MENFYLSAMYTRISPSTKRVPMNQDYKEQGFIFLKELQAQQQQKIIISLIGCRQLRERIQNLC